MPSAYDHQPCQDGNLPWIAPNHNCLTLYPLVITLPLGLARSRDKTMVMTYLKGLLSIKAHDLLLTWYFRSTWQTKNIASSLPQCLRLPDLAGWSHTLRPISQTALLTKNIFLLQQYYYQTWKFGNITWGNP